MQQSCGVCAWCGPLVITNPVVKKDLVVTSVASVLDIQIFEPRYAEQRAKK
jgi:hypothetical protein